jgi:hypothetical protein
VQSKFKQKLVKRREAAAREQTQASEAVVDAGKALQDVLSSEIKKIDEALREQVRSWMLARARC